MASTGDDDRDPLDDAEDDDDSEFDSEFDDDGARDEAPANPAVAVAGVAQDANPNPNAAPAPPSGSNPTPTHHPRRRARSAASEESRRAFQKLWTNEDEIELLRGFLDFTTRRGTAHADYQYDTGPFFDQIKPRLRPEFNTSQLVEKLRRLKRKYRSAAARIAAGRDEASVFKSRHDRETFQISQHIWSSSFSRARKRRASASGKDLARVYAPPPPVSSAVEETLRACLSPLFKELMQSVVGGSGGSGDGLLTVNPQLGSGTGMEERWKQQRILELEVFLKRVELVQEQVKAALEELRSTE